MNKKKISPQDLPTKKVRAPDGTSINLKVVNADSENLDLELLAAFRSNVRRIVDKRRQNA